MSCFKKLAESSVLFLIPKKKQKLLDSDSRSRITSKILSILVSRPACRTAEKTILRRRRENADTDFYSRYIFDVFSSLRVRISLVKQQQYDV